jgi:lysophospholipase L1-like esterase
VLTDARCGRGITILVVPSHLARRAQNAPARRLRPLSRKAVAAVAVTLMASALAACAGTGQAPAASHPGRTARPAPGAAAPAGHDARTGTGRDQGKASAPAGRVQAAEAPGPQTSCRSVVHIGDSTSDGLVLPAYQPDAALRIARQYRDVGVTNFIPEVSGARSLVETWHGIPNGYTVAQQLVRGGYVGCWVIALGTNDAADVAVGSAVNMPTRIRDLMNLLSPEPVMWVNVVTLLHSGPYAESMMQEWNRDLLQACARYPNMRVYNWAAVARPSWFIPDGIHYTPYGYAQRSRDIAQALAQAFPAHILSPRLFEGSDVFRPLAASGCLVQ